METEAMNGGAIVIGQVSHIPGQVIIGIAIVAVITNDSALDGVDTAGTQGSNNLIDDIGLAWQEHRADGGIAQTTDHDVTLEGAVNELAIEIHRRLKTEVGSQQSQGGRGNHRLHRRSGDIGLFWSVTADALGGIQVNDLHTHRGVTQDAVGDEFINGALRREGCKLQDGNHCQQY